MKIREQVQARYQVEDIVMGENYGVEYQPIICTRTGEITAYEALARFYLPNGTSIAPDIAFQILHEEMELLCKAELDLKKLQIDYAPQGYDVFINIDPHAIRVISNIASDPLISLLIGKQHIVVELIENIDIHDAHACTVLHDELGKSGIRTALDDIGSPHALTSLQLMLLVNYLKFDRMWLVNLHKTKHSGLLEALLGFAVNSEKTTVLEGIETKTMLETARSFAVDYVQGFLFKSMFKLVRP